MRHTDAFDAGGLIFQGGADLRHQHAFVVWLDNDDIATCTESTQCGAIKGGDRCAIEHGHIQILYRWQHTAQHRSYGYDGGVVASSYHLQLTEAYRILYGIFAHAHPIIGRRAIGVCLTEESIKLACVAG